MAHTTSGGMAHTNFVGTAAPPEHVCVRDTPPLSLGDGTLVSLGDGTLVSLGDGRLVPWSRWVGSQASACVGVRDTTFSLGDALDSTTSAWFPAVDGMGRDHVTSGCDDTTAYVAKASLRVWRRHHLLHASSLPLVDSLVSMAEGCFLGVDGRRLLPWSRWRKVPSFQWLRPSNG